MHKLIVMALVLGVCGCSQPNAADLKIVDVEHTAIERQSIGNCWLYAQASWIESLHKSETGEDFDLSESYLTYWHWFSQINESTTEVSTGGSYQTASRLIRKYGLMSEAQFVFVDTLAEMSYRQADALDRINQSLAFGLLSSAQARADRALVRRELNVAWGLTPEVVAQLDAVFGLDAAKHFLNQEANHQGTNVLRADEFPVRYAAWDEATGAASFVVGDLAQALREWRSESLWNIDRQQQIRLQKALHARQPVLISWAVDFNALDNSPTSERRGAFHADALRAAGEPGRQGFHMTALEDYEVATEEFGVLPAGVTLDPEQVGAAAKLAAALLPTSKLIKLRIKNSWGANRPDRAFLTGMPGYHDLYMDYLTRPILWCEDEEITGTPTERGCSDLIVPLNEMILPPGF